MKKSSKKSRKLQREKAERLAQESAKWRAARIPGVHRESIHVPIIYWVRKRMTVNGNAPRILVHTLGTDQRWKVR